MRKIFLLLCVVAFSVSAKAQVHLGGSFGITRDDDIDATNFTLAPEISHMLNDTWHFGAEIGYTHTGKTQKDEELDVCLDKI